ncbi:hypothetical protein EQU06_03800 [Lactobacillus sanfranciscensis]|uniref:Uncharacterized protein n=1 Tax=Fructilactobacillus sanfranciscensis (strain TMW 1.1304) TaxID=714313 RepID=G2KTV4_FRUST|nr:hypothetical protein [Fructilactobacillus sanfranciscensis]AEN98547.1 hypothetical protein LSA_00580 [Fructilactobacillus sanfranciscensis TMW 1.1304]NDR76011.1 hypothetical protein [Fructilactobacillus sanfranciscensis]NDR96695.1 hypothetical protein [Fructilactobacillus sanfranciscensis]NDS04491.1 hypothetical protein [Fructilactobacillus sanfranciscensis]POH17812.1 hypothetical protein BGL44_03340 [Fructilactobacillus sanfranciscensis]
MLKKNLNLIIIGLFYVLSVATLFLYENVLIPSNRDEVELQGGLVSSFAGGVVSLLLIQLFIWLGYKLFAKVDKTKLQSIRRVASEKIITFLGILLIIKLLVNFGIDTFQLPELISAVVSVVIIGLVFYNVYRKQHHDDDFNKNLFYFDLILVLLLGH